MKAHTVYLIHFDQPYKHAKHYVGCTSLTITQRLAKHRDKQTGAKLLLACQRAGIGYKVVRIFPNLNGNGWDIEKRIKASHVPQLCPICNPDGWQNHFKELETEALTESV